MPSTLLSLASKQVWPHVLVVSHLRPERLILLHSSEAEESEKPARRLRDFFIKSGLLSGSSIQTVRIPHDDMRQVESICREIRGKAKDASWLTHFTGGNKLMATGAFLDAIRNKVPACYLERGNRLFWFKVENRDLTTSSEKIDGHIADKLDALDLLLCQMSHTELSGRGEKLQLREDVSTESFHKQLLTNAHSFFTSRRRPASEPQRGDSLEYAVAAIALWRGVKSVYRSVGIREAGTTKEQTDFDVVFNYGGKLWLVDCKDRTTHRAKFTKVRHFIDKKRDGADAIFRSLQQLENEAEATHYIWLKQAILDVQRAGGLLGKVVFVRKSVLPAEVMQFAADLGVPVLTKETLYSGLQELLDAS
ncbi:MAG: DUF1887 family protein [Verrucomicrobia bacterium]|nr:DUF1887 family protein [Verrucomicrobiota bacterium]